MFEVADLKEVDRGLGWWCLCTGAGFRDLKNPGPPLPYQVGVWGWRCRFSVGGVLSGAFRVPEKDWHWVHQDFFYSDENPQIGGGQRTKKRQWYSDSAQVGIDFFWLIRWFNIVCTRKLHNFLKRIGADRVVSGSCFSDAILILSTCLYIFLALHEVWFGNESQHRAYYLYILWGLASFSFFPLNQELFYWFIKINSIALTTLLKSPVFLLVYFFFKKTSHWSYYISWGVT